jgi:hypothetical protein
VLVGTTNREVSEVFVRKKKHHDGGSAYYQLVESRRIDGQPRQKVVMHLGRHATVEDALKGWRKEIARLRRGGYEVGAEKLAGKLERLKALHADAVA